MPSPSWQYEIQGGGWRCVWRGWGRAWEEGTEIVYDLPEATAKYWTVWRSMNSTSRACWVSNVWSSLNWPPRQINICDLKTIEQWNETCTLHSELWPQLPCICQAGHCKIELTWNWKQFESRRTNRRQNLDERYGPIRWPHCNYSNLKPKSTWDCWNAVPFHLSTRESTLGLSVLSLPLAMTRYQSPPVVWNETTSLAPMVGMDWSYSRMGMG